MKKCPKCGYVTDDNSLSFCIKCGSRLTEGSNDNNSADKSCRYCGKCGYVNNKDARFCAKCGFPLEILNVDNKTAASVRKITKGQLIAVCMGTAILLALGIILSIFCLRNRNTSVPISQNSNITVTETTVFDEKAVTDNTDNTVRVLVPDPDEGKLFRHGLMPASDEYGKWGYIDNSGVFVIEPQFSKAKNFSQNGLAPVCNQYGIWGYIDTTGEYVIRSQYSSASPFNGDGLAVVSIADASTYSWNNSSYRDLLYGYIDEFGKVVIEPKFSYASDFASNGLAVVKVSTNNDDLYGYIDYSGEYVIEPQYTAAEPFAENGLAAAAVAVKNEENNYNINKYGYINAKGEFVIEPQYISAGIFDSEGTASVSLIDYDSAFDGSFGEIYGCIDENGNQVIDFKYGYLSSFDKTGHARYSERGIACNNTYGIIDRNENIIYDNYENYGATIYNCGLANINGYGYIDEYGDLVIASHTFAATSFFNDGYAMIDDMSSIKIIDTQGNIVKDELHFVNADNNLFADDRLQNYFINNYNYDYWAYYYTESP